MPPRTPILPDPARPVLLAGPTASGKSALALRIAEAQGRAIVNADALQVHDSWRVLTARPGAEDCARAPHLLYGHVPRDADYSVGHWLREVATLLPDRPNPVIVGGTGLYFTALTEGLAADPPRTARRARRGGGAAADGRPAGAARRSRPRHRRPHRSAEPGPPAARVGGAARHRPRTRPVAGPDRSAPPAAVAGNAAAADARPRPAGAANRRPLRGHVARRRARRGARRPAALAGHVQPGRLAALDPRHRRAGTDRPPPGQMSLAAAEAAATLATRRYAKRQRTWFRNRMQGWQRIEPG
jgi:tRNA dimethylallyltransferase